MTVRFELERWALLLLAFALPLACAPTQAARPAQECPRPVESVPPAAPTPAHDIGEEHAYTHEHAVDAAPSHATVTEHAALPSFENHGNTLRGIATPASGARNYEVWRTSVAVGGATPLHRHESEEVFIFLQGKGKARIGEQEYTFEAPATVVAPANVPHQFFNIGDVPTDAIVVVGVGSKIWDGAGNEMQLPWRK